MKGRASSPHAKNASERSVGSVLRESHCTAIARNANPLTVKKEEKQLFKFKSESTPKGRRTQFQVSGPVLVAVSLLLVGVFNPDVLLLILPTLLS